MNTKFKEGQWINNKVLNSTGCIISIENNRYEIELTDGSKAFPDIDYIDRNFHLWRIEDAQDGDIIITPNGNIFIFKRINSSGQILDYCGIYNGTFYPESGSPNGKIIPECCKDYKPATSEQRNILWQRMREAGYKWNSRTKEVVKAPFKLEGTLFSAADRGKIDEIIFALKNLEKDKMLCYSEEIKFLEKIRKL